jgi:predicted acylesterase/phospholipase RssA
MTRASAGVQAVVLSGGGANGAYEVGVLKALLGGRSPATNYQPIELEIAAGTSIGAFNAALLLSHLPGLGAAVADFLERVWLDLIPQDDDAGHNFVFRYRADPFEALDPEFNLRRPGAPWLQLAEDLGFFAQDWLRRGLDFLREPQELEQRALRLFDLSTIISNEPAERLIKETVRFDELRRTSRSLRITATNWRTGAAKTFENHELTDSAGPRAVLASTAVPGIFPQVEIDGEYYADGGVVLNTPLAPAIRAGADDLHVVYLDPEVEAIPLLPLRNTLDTISRFFAIQFAATVNRDIEVALSINRWIGIIEQAERNGVLSNIDADSFIRAASARVRPEGVARYRKLTIHRYQPCDTLGNVLGILNFDRARIGQLIEQGFADAERHDCAANRCVLPETG